MREATARTAPVEAGSRGAIRRGLIVRSPAMRRLAQQLDRIRDSELPVLIDGETGTGKELVARTIHVESPRSGAPFLVLDCATLPDALLEVELFGAVRGAFTGSDVDRPGILTRIDRGTLLFDEVGATSLDVQAKLLRLLATGEYRPVGASEARHADIRFLFATSRDLESEALAGRFRRDLLHRIRILALRVPPLSGRREDIPALARLFLEESGESPPELEPGFLDRLAARPWPGNVRELRNLLCRLRLEHTRRIPAAAAVTDGPLPPEGGASRDFPEDLLAGSSLEELRASLERDYILHHLQRLGGDTRAVAELLGIGRKQLYRRCRALGIRLRGRRGGV